MAVVEKKSACSLLSRHMLSCRKLGPPALKNIKGMMTTAAKIMAINCAKSVMTEARNPDRSEEHTPELQSRGHLVCRLPLEKKKAASYFTTLPHETFFIPPPTH